MEKVGASSQADRPTEKSRDVHVFPCSVLAKPSEYANVPLTLSLLCMSPALLFIPHPTQVNLLSWFTHPPNLPGKNCGKGTHRRQSSAVSCGSGCLHKRFTASFILRDVNSKNVSSCHCRCKCQKLAFFHQKME